MRFTRVTLFFIAFIIALGFYQLARHFLAEVEPQTFQATEEMMVDTANLLAEIVEDDLAAGSLDVSSLSKVFSDARSRKFEARIFDHLKTQVGLHVYITDEKGIVVFDSDGGKLIGQDLRSKRDVSRTLQGSYGARSTRLNPESPVSSVLHVAAPIGPRERPIGVLTVYKAQLDVMPLVRERRRIIYTACALIGGGIAFLIGAVFLWLFRPIGRITEYALAIERGGRPAKPKIGIGREVNTLAHALDSMRDALEDRNYVQSYVQTLTHELKSPLAAIRGAAELLREDMPVDARKRFLGNILAETSRSERLINRMLELSAIESRRSLGKTTLIDVGELTGLAIDQARPLAELADVSVAFQSAADPVFVPGDAFILRAAVTNLLENAIDFSPKGAEVQVTISASEESIEVRIRDHGPGVPEYAKERVFERFYSLRHHSSRRKGTGLGLTLVQEAAALHGGSIELRDAKGGGTEAILRLPAEASVK